MKKAFLVLLMVAVCGNAFAQVEKEPNEKAEKVYVLVDKIGVVNDEKYNTAKGDVVVILPYTEQYKPTDGEIAIFNILVLELTPSEQKNLLEPLRNEEGEVIKKRLISVETKTLDSLKQEIQIEKSTFDALISIKSISEK